MESPMVGAGAPRAVGTAGPPGAGKKRRGGRTRPPYAREFKAEAIALVRRGGVPVARVARDLGVSPDTLRGWVKQTDIDAGRREGLTTEERAELTQLRRENRLLKMERDLLKKATVFFAREGDTIR